ncbi:MAG: HAMP domain-containing protein [Deltaproteobacteria bacterium]|nr:HAMP domain-containing protein [Deltaproteobacteria bacterium]
MRISILIKLMVVFAILGLVPPIVIGIVSLKDARNIGYGAAKDAHDLGTEVVADTTDAITRLVGNSFLKLAKQISNQIQNNLSEREKDTLWISKLVASKLDNLEMMANELEQFSAASKKEIWFNTGTDEAPKEGRAIIPLYTEISFVDATGVEQVKIVDGKRQETLRDISKIENTTFLNETIFEQTKALSKDDIYVSRLNTWYISQDEVRKDVPADSEAWNIIPGRDTMKSGNIRFASPVYSDSEFKGIVILSLDYRHIQSWTKHIDPADENPVVSTSYEGNYILMFDDSGDTLVHPKPNNIRGYLPDGKLEHRNTVATPGGIFNLKYFDKSNTYKEIYDVTINKGEDLIKSAVDVKGRNKMTISVPIPYKKGEYQKTGYLGGIMLSVNTDKFYETAQNTEQKIESKIAATNQRIKLKTEGVQTQNTILVITLITIFFVIILSLIVANTITRPLRALTKVANIISEGTVNVKIPEIKTRDEIYDLGESLKAVLAAVDLFQTELGIDTGKEQDNG